MRPRQLLSPCILLLFACEGETTPHPEDRDGDGYLSIEDGGEDCDDKDVANYPGAAEIPYDGVDQDCDGEDWTDVDGDGFYSVSVGGSDCDDQDAQIYPGAPESWYDAVDQDCDDANDFDADGDGVPYPEDCDDVDPQTYPGAEEIWYDGKDQDCGGGSDFDQDEDGDDSDAYGGGDCDDDTPWINSQDVEIPNDGVDQDCDGGDLVGDRIEEIATAIMQGGFGAEAGTSLDGPVDFNADGYGDILIGAPTGYGDKRGRTYIVYGPEVAGRDLFIFADVVFYGEATEDYYSEAGFDVAAPGDVNGDGYPDVLIGSNVYWDKQEADRAYLAYGPFSGQIELVDESVQLIRGGGWAGIGSIVSGAGDINGDGLADLLVGSSWHDGAYLVYGPASFEGESTFRLDENYAATMEGTGVMDGLGDVDGDGMDDFAVKLYTGGGVFLFSDPVSGVIEASDALASLLHEEDYPIEEIGPAGDVNSDGYLDVILGCPGVGAVQGGAAYLLYGPWSGTAKADEVVDVIWGEEHNSHGSSASGVGDLNQDEADDISIGAIGLTPGRVYTFYGPISGSRTLSDADSTIIGEGEGWSYTGWDIVGVGDFDGDFLTDFTVSAPYYDQDTYEGRVYLLSGSAL